MSILFAGKVTSENSDKDDVFIDSKNRGGLWKVTSEVMNIFTITEKHFRNNTESFERKINVVSMVSSLLTDYLVLSNFTVLRNLASEEVSEEVSLNLECMLTLYLRARTFKYVTLKKESFMLAAQKKKMKSLRTSIKQSSSKLEQGH